MTQPPGSPCNNYSALPSTTAKNSQESTASNGIRSTMPPPQNTFSLPPPPPRKLPPPPPPPRPPVSLPLPPQAAGLVFLDNKNQNNNAPKSSSSPMLLHQQNQQPQQLHQQGFNSMQSSSPPHSFRLPPPPPPPPPGQQQQQQQQRPQMQQYTYQSQTGTSNHQLLPPPSPQKAAMTLSNQPPKSLPPTYNGYSSPVNPRVPPSPVYPPTPTPTANNAANNNNYSNNNNKIDIDKMPRPLLFTRPHVSDNDSDGVSSQQDDSLLPIYYPKAALLHETTQALPPPPADSRYHTIDDGNATPNFMRASVYSIPRDRGVWHKTGDLYLGVICTPLSQRTKSIQQHESNNDSINTPSFVEPPGQTTNNQHASSSNSTESKNHDLDSLSAAEMEILNSEFVPLIVTNDPPPRCTQCLAYMNPYWDKQAGRCNFCGNRQKSFSLSTSFSSFNTYNYSGINNVYAGINELECQYGTVEYTVNGPYVTRDTPVQGHTFIYAIDLTCIHIMPYLRVLYQATTKAQELYPKGKGLRVGIVLVSAGGIVLCRKPCKTNDNTTNGNHHTINMQQYTVMPDISEEPFCPLPLHDWMYQLNDETDNQDWKSLLTMQLPTDIPILQQQLAKGSNAANSGSNWELSPGGAALAFLVDALAAVGGRGVFISRRRPNHGIGTLPHRNEAVQPGRNVQQFHYKAYTPIQYQNPTLEKDIQVAEFYKNLGAMSAKNRVALDIIMHTSTDASASFLDLATLGEVCRISCGKLVWLSVQQDWETTLEEELLRTLTANAGWDAVFKLRCSEGLQIKTFLSGPGILMESSTLGGSPELEMTCVMPNTSIAVELEHRVGGISKSNKYAFLQGALLYTTMNGERRVRVSTLALRISAIPEDVYLSADFGTVAALYLRRTALSMNQLPSEVSERIALRGKLREAIYHKALHVVASYRQNTQAVASPISQLLLPKKLQLLPLFCMSFMKSCMLQPGTPLRLMDSQVLRMTPSGDERAYYNFYVENYADPRTAMMLLYPRIFCLTGLASNVGRHNASKSSIGYVSLPILLSPSINSLDDTEVYLIDGGLKCYLYVGQHASDEAKEIIQHLETKSQVLDNLLWQLRVWTATSPYEAVWRRPTRLPLQIVHQSSKPQDQTASYQTILSLLVADAVGGEQDYTDFLCTMHQRISEKVSAAK